MFVLYSCQEPLLLSGYCNKTAMLCTLCKHFGRSAEIKVTHLANSSSAEMRAAKPCFFYLLSLKMHTYR